jgi:hypothetical protein
MYQTMKLFIQYHNIFDFIFNTSQQTGLPYGRFSKEVVLNRILLMNNMLEIMLRLTVFDTVVNNIYFHFERI